MTAALPVLGGHRRVRGASRALMAVSLAVAVALLAPVVFLIMEASQAGRHEITRLLFRHLTEELLWNTVRLAALVTIGCAVVGTGAAFAIERTDVPVRRLWAVLVVVPLAIPDFVVSYAWVSATPSVHGLWGAALVMTLALYPLVYLPVSAALRRGDTSLEDTSRSLGIGAMMTFWRVTVPQIRRAVLGGCLVVCLALLAEYGAFEILRYQTFTTTIFAEFKLGFNSPAACALSIVLVLIGIVVLIGESAANRGDRRSHNRSGSRRTSNRPPRRHVLGRGTIGVVSALVALVILSLGVPVGAILYWLVNGSSTTLPGISIVSSIVDTASYSATAAAIATVLALPVAILTVRHRSRFTMIIERSTYVVQSLPGLVVALSFVFFALHYASGFYQSSELLSVAYAVLFFPLALICVLTSVGQAPSQLQDMGRSLGQGRISVFLRITLPLIAPGLAAGFCLVFLSAVTELTATLILIPTGAHTLATQFWKYENNAAYGAAAPYAAVMVGVALVPSYLLARWFNRRATDVVVV